MGDGQFGFEPYQCDRHCAAPNAGNVLVAEPGNRRVQELTSTGGFVRTFGWDTVTDGLSGHGV
jgi:hypothetical protein